MDMEEKKLEPNTEQNLPVQELPTDIPDEVRQKLAQALNEEATEDLKHRVLRWEKIPFEAPACTKEVPEGFSWQWQNDALYQDSTQFRLDDSGWLIDPKTNEYVDAHTGWYYVAAENCLMDKASGM